MTYNHKTLVSAVVYVRNNAKEIECFLRTIYGVFIEIFAKFEIICVNDASDDNSGNIINKLESSFADCKISIINMSYFHGREAAMHTGVDFAIGDFVFEFDSLDIDYELDMVMQVYSRSLQGFDIVSCGSADTRLFPRLFYYIYNLSAGSQHRIQSETFRILSRRAINRVRSMSVKLPYRKALYSYSGLEMDFILYEATVSGIHKTTRLKNSQDTAITSLLIFTNIAYRISMLLSLIMAASMFGFGLYTVIVYFGTRRPVEGWAPLMGLISAGFFGVFILLTIVAKYLDILLKNAFNKQAYLVSSIDR